MSTTKLNKSESEWLTRLRWLAEHDQPCEMPEWMTQSVGGWAKPISDVAKAALAVLDKGEPKWEAMFATLRRWRHKVRGTSAPTDQTKASASSSTAP